MYIYAYIYIAMYVRVWIYKLPKQYSARRENPAWNSSEMSIKEDELTVEHSYKKNKLVNSMT